MENATIIMMVANRTWPVPPAVTEADKAASNWIDTHDTRTSNSLVIGAHAASGRIDYDASTPGIERFREFFHSLPPERRTGSAQLMMNYYMSMGFDMRSNEQRKADEKLNMPKVPTPEERAKAERDKANADDAAQAERDRKVFDGIKAMDRLRDKIKQSKEEPVPEVAAEEKKVLTTPDRGQNPDQDDLEPEQPTGPEVIEGPGQPPVDGSSGGACDGAGSCGD